MRTGEDKKSAILATIGIVLTLASSLPAAQYLKYRDP
jgi:hypothetical protein